MLILNTLTIILQIIFVGFISILCMNILRQFSSAVKKMSVIGPAIFVNHGGGPLPLLGDPDNAGITKFLKNEVPSLINIKQVKAIILVTAHWQEQEVTISSGKKHDLYFDYYGFPAESYTYRYDAPGHPELAERIHAALKGENIPSKLDSKRGWDHGVFVPMMLINPAANIPIVQVSVMRNQDPDQHYKLGKVLHQFRKENIAVIGSGMTYHNMGGFFTKFNQVVNENFDSKLSSACLADSEEERRKELVNWRKFPQADSVHLPKAAEHFMPLIVVAGAGGSKPGEKVSSYDMKGTIRLSSFMWKHE